MLLSFDGTLIVQILNFVVFWALLNYLFIAPTRRKIETRMRYIDQQYDECDRLTAEAQAINSQAEELLMQARRDTERTMRAAATHAAREVKALESKTAEEANAIVQLAVATVASERALAAADAAPFVESLAREMVDRAVGLTKVA